ncbi:putative protein phosphatase 2C 9 [Frankliniella fusca]|uniref:Uncharacterized protein n=1 Tax=Frankliniella fusca TaxID=407009 RepID=A0AAE1GYY7_9NEOP|nr:putative protein phosphatase 2C 9 [Frankliniella fusca]
MGVGGSDSTLDSVRHLEKGKPPARRRIVLLAPAAPPRCNRSGLFAMFVVQASAGRRLTSKDITNFSLMKNRNILAGIVKGILTVLIT